jgi:hypothetical protein
MGTPLTCLLMMILFSTMLVDVIAAIGSFDNDEATLLAFKAKLDGDGLPWLASWNQSSNYCSW